MSSTVAATSAGISEACWLTRQVGRIEMRFRADSHAASDVERLSSGFAHLQSEIVRLLGVQRAAIPSVRVSLGGIPAEGDGPQQPAEAEPTSAELEVSAIYMPETPAGSAELEAARALLPPLLGLSRPEARIWVEGLASLLAIGPGCPSHQGDPVARCRQLLLDGLLPPLEELVATSPTRPSPLAQGVIAAFTCYLVDRYGPGRYRRFLREVRRGDKAAFRRVYHRSLAVVDRDWRRHLEATGPGPSSGWRTTRLLYPVLRPYWWDGLRIVLYTLVGIAFSLALPLAFRFLIDNILGRRPLQMAIPLVGGPGHVISDGTEQLRHLLGLSLFLGLLYLLNGAARWRLTTLVNRLGEAFAHDLRQRQLDVLTRLPAAYFARTPIADINQRVMHDTASVQVVLTGALVPLLAGLLSIALYSVMLISIQAQLALLAFLAIPILGLIYRVRRRNLMAAVRERARRMADLSGRVNELAAAQALVKIYTAAPALLRALGGRLDLHRQLNIAYAQESSVLGQASGLVMHLIQVAVLLVGGYLVVIGNGEDLTPGELVAFYMLMNQLFGPVTSVAAARQTIAGASASAERVSDLLDEAPEHDPPNGVELGQLKESICLEAVTFAYPGGRPVLQDLDLTIPAGSTVAFVGPTGAGKSSLVQLLPRLYDSTAGRVSWDGVDLRSARLESLRRQVALVPQDSLLVSGTVAENIRFGLAEATDAALESAARQAGAHEFIVGLSEGYDTLLGDHGVGLSGGQRQRIALARALLRQPSVLILDEATSALDSTTQRIVQEALRADPRRTIVKIAHRLETVADARVIFVLDGGRLVEQGTHKALLAKDGVYARLFRDQMSLLTAAGKPTARQAVRWLARFSPFAELSPAVREELATVIQTVERPAGETIYRAGSAGDELYVVGRGRVDVLLSDESGRQQIVNTLGTGTLFGVEAFFRAQPRATSVHTSTDVLLFVLPRVGYQAVLERSSGALATGISV